MAPDPGEPLSSSERWKQTSVGSFTAVLAHLCGKYAWVRKLTPPQGPGEADSKGAEKA